MVKNRSINWVSSLSPLHNVIVYLPGLLFIYFIIYLFTSLFPKRLKFNGVVVIIFTIYPFQFRFFEIFIKNTKKFTFFLNHPCVPLLLSKKTVTLVFPMF